METQNIRKIDQE